MRDATAKLFHCVVVMGAALGSGCGTGGLVGSDAGADGSGAGAPSGGGASGGGGDDAADAQDCAVVQTVFGIGAGCGYRGACPGTRTAPLSPLDCAQPQDLVCGIASSPTGCRCFAGSPRTAADCANPADFTCADWTMPCGCQCVGGSPTAAEQCCPAAPDAGLDAADADAAPSPAPYCATPWTCHSYDPPTGCTCRMIPPPIL